MHTQILVLLASESVKFLITAGGNMQEDSNMVKVRPLLLSQQRRSNTSVTHKDLTEGSFCHRHKMLLSNSHFIIKHQGPACALMPMNCWVDVSKAKVYPRPNPHYHTTLPGNRAWELLKGQPGLLADLLTASWRGSLTVWLPSGYSLLRGKIRRQQLICQTKSLFSLQRICLFSIPDSYFKYIMIYQPLFHFC